MYGAPPATWPLPDAIAAATPDKLQELVALLVERVETANQHVGRVAWVPAARPFFRDIAAEAEDEAALVWRPRRVSGAQDPTHDPLAWYAA